MKLVSVIKAYYPVVNPKKISIYIYKKMAFLAVPLKGDAEEIMEVGRHMNTTV